MFFTLLYGELPSDAQFTEFNDRLVENYAYDNRLEPFVKAFDTDLTKSDLGEKLKQTKAHPMAILSTLISVFSSFYPEANPAFVSVNIYNTQKERDVHIHRMLGCAPAVAAACFRIFQGE